MNKLPFLLLILLLSSACHCHKKTHKQEKTAENTSVKPQKTNGIEKIKILPQTKIHLEQDEWGQHYIKLLPGTKTVFSYSYKNKPNDTNIKDANIGERILFEWEGNLQEMELRDKALKQVNLIVSYYGFRNENTTRIDKGLLSVKQIDKENYLVRIIIEQKLPNLLIKEIKTVIKLKK